MQKMCVLHVIVPSYLGLLAKLKLEEKKKAIRKILVMKRSSERLASTNNEQIWAIVILRVFYCTAGC